MSQQPPVLISTPQQFHDMVLNPETIPKQFRVENLIGRIVKGRRDKPEEFLQLTDDAIDRTAFMFGEDGVEKLLEIAAKFEHTDGKLSNGAALEMFHLIGFEESYVKEKISQNVRFELLIISKSSFMNDSGSFVEVASWDGICSLVEHVFPRIHPICCKYLDQLKTTTFEEIKKMADFDFGEIRRFGSSHPLYFNEEKFFEYCKEKKLTKNEEPSLLDIRTFFYYACGMRELYSGDGWTYTEKGVKGLKEYLGQNIKRSQLVDHTCMHLDV